MDEYCVNKNPETTGTGEHEVHNVTKGCIKMPNSGNRVALGSFVDCHGAVKKAKSMGYDADGCGHCCKPCNTR